MRVELGTWSHVDPWVQCKSSDGHTPSQIWLLSTVLPTPLLEVTTLSLPLLPAPPGECGTLCQPGDPPGKPEPLLAHHPDPYKALPAGMAREEAGGAGDQEVDNISVVAAFSSVWELGLGQSYSLVCLGMGQEPVEF